MASPNSVWLAALVLLGAAFGPAQACRAAPGAAHGRTLMQGGTRTCSDDASLQESIDYLSTQFEAALKDALASGLITPPAEYIAGRVASLYVLMHSGDLLPARCNWTDATEHALDALRDATSAISEKFCEQDYAAGILGLNVSRAAATLEKAGVKEQLESQGADETIAWATKLLFPQFGYGVMAFAKVCTTLPGVDYTYPTETCDSSGCTGSSGSTSGSTAGLDPSILEVPRSGDVVAAIVAPDAGAYVGIP